MATRMEAAPSIRKNLSNGGHEETQGGTWDGVKAAVKEPFTWLFCGLHFHLPLLLGEPLGIMGPIREKKEGNNGNQNGGCSLDLLAVTSSWYNKKESPTRMAIWHAGNTISNVISGLLKESVHIVENSCGEET
jgi:hypothetical protein